VLYRLAIKHAGLGTLNKNDPSPMIATINSYRCSPRSTRPPIHAPTAAPNAYPNDDPPDVNICLGTSGCISPHLLVVAHSLVQDERLLQVCVNSAIAQRSTPSMFGTVIEAAGVLGAGTGVASTTGYAPHPTMRLFLLQHPRSIFYTVTPQHTLTHPPNLLDNLPQRNLRIHSTHHLCTRTRTLTLSTFPDPIQTPSPYPATSIG
jgi:hypothetical protein